MLCCGLKNLKEKQMTYQQADQTAQFIDLNVNGFEAPGH